MVERVRATLMTNDKKDVFRRYSADENTYKNTNICQKRKRIICAEERHKIKEFRVDEYDRVYNIVCNDDNQKRHLSYSRNKKTCITDSYNVLSKQKHIGVENIINANLFGFNDLQNAQKENDCKKNNIIIEKNIRDVDQKINLYKISAKNDTDFERKILNKRRYSVDFSYMNENDIVRYNTPKLVKYEGLDQKNLLKSYGTIKRAFLNKELATSYEIKALIFLRDNIIRCPKKNQNLLNIFILPEDDEYTTTEKDKNIITGIETLTTYAKRKKFNKDIFLEIFSAKHIINLVEQLRCDCKHERESLMTLIIYILKGCDETIKCIKLAVKNEMVFYNEKARYFLGIFELIAITKVLKENFMLNENEKIFFLEFILFPILKSNVVSQQRAEMFINVLNSFMMDDKDMTNAFLRFVHRVFSTVQTTTKAIILSILKNIYSAESAVFSLQTHLNTFCKAIDVSFLSHNFILINLISLMINDNAIYHLIRENIEIVMPYIFKSMYELARTYWLAEEKGKILVVIQKIIRCKEKLFCTCLKEYNLQNTKTKLQEQFNDELTNALFESCLQLDIDTTDLEKMRKRSLLPCDIFENHKKE